MEGGGGGGGRGHSHTPDIFQLIVSFLPSKKQLSSENRYWEFVQQK